jgi:hypothetical protein
VWFAAPPRAEVVQERSKIVTFDPKTLQVGDILKADGCGDELVIGLGKRGYAVEDHGDFLGTRSWSDLANHCIFREGKQIYPPPEPEWRPKPGVLLYHDTPMLVKESAPSMALGPDLWTLDGQQVLIFNAVSIKPYVAPVDDAAEIIRDYWPDLPDEISHAEDLAQAICVLYYLIPKAKATP